MWLTRALTGVLADFADRLFECFVGNELLFTSLEGEADFLRSVHRSKRSAWMRASIERARRWFDDCKPVRHGRDDEARRTPRHRKRADGRSAAPPAETLPVTEGERVPSPAESGVAFTGESARDERTSVVACVRPEAALAESAVPWRTRRCEVSHISHRAAFVLMHVDGRTDIRTIARLVGLPVTHLTACFDELVAAGLLELLPRAG